MARKVYDALVTTRKYKDKITGEKKKVRVNVGAVFENNGNLSLKLEMMPIGSDWSGWISFFPVESRPEPPRREPEPEENVGRDYDIKAPPDSESDLAF